MKKVLLTATVQSHICQFHKPLVQMLHAHGYEVHAAARNNLEEKNGLSIDFIDKVFDLPFSRSPWSPDNIKAYRELKKIIEQEEYEYIHCNTPVGGIVTRLAAIRVRKNGTKVFYTAHGFHFYHGANIINWLIYYPVEKIMAHYCDTLITINDEDYQLAKKKFKTNVERIHGVGVDENRFHEVSHEEAISLRQKEGLEQGDYVILCVGELNENKNQKTLIRAVEEIKKQIPNLITLLAGNGPKEEELRDLIRDADLEDQVQMLGYRRDIEFIIPFIDLAVSCSYREGLGMNVLEAQLCKKPVIASINRGHKELISDGCNGYLIEPDNAHAFASRIYSLYRDKALSEKMGENGYKMTSAYTVSSVIKELISIYDLQ